MVSVKYKCDVCGVWASFTDDGALCDKCLTDAEIAEEAKRIDEVCFEVRLRGVDPDMIHYIKRDLSLELQQFEGIGRVRNCQILMTHRSDKAEVSHGTMSVL